MRTTLHRWWVLSFVALQLTLAAARSIRRARRRRGFWRKVEAWPW